MRVLNGPIDRFTKVDESDGRTVRVTIGTHNPLTPDRARRLARVKLGEMAKGIDDSLLEKKVAASGITLGEWGMTTLGVCLAILRSAREQREVAL